ITGYNMGKRDFLQNKGYKVKLTIFGILVKKRILLGILGQKTRFGRFGIFIYTAVELIKPR
ncbi:hypothetical protein, partial [Vibrio vulnificus]|uniref:hypothetical protein n=1 Tax=Vibrio vulnificus TaxID=672 RepID=UPI001CA52989